MEYARDVGIPGLLEVNAPLIDEQGQYRTLVDRVSATSVSERAFQAASRLIAVSQGVAEYLADFMGDGDRVHVVPNGVDPGRFPENLRPALPAGRGAFTVGFVGSMRPWHGLPVLIDAFARLQRADPSSRLLVVGDGPERPNLVSDLSARGLLGAVHLTGQVAPNEVPALLASMDAAAAPYPPLPRFYFSPLKIYEYMAAGLPVVASRIGQLAELIDPEANGLLCPPGDAAALASALTRLQHDRALRGRLGRAARATIRHGHSWTAVVRRLLAVAGIDPVEERRHGARVIP